MPESASQEMIVTVFFPTPYLNDDRIDVGSARAHEGAQGSHDRRQQPNGPHGGDGCKHHDQRERNSLSSSGDQVGKEKRFNLSLERDAFARLVSETRRRQRARGEG